MGGEDVDEEEEEEEEEISGGACDLCLEIDR